MSTDREFNTLVIVCGNIKTAFEMVDTRSPRKTEQLQVDGCWQIKLHLSLADGFNDLKEKCQTTDAYILLYDMTRPQTVAIYDSFIKDIIRTKNKAVRVIGLKPKSNNASVRGKSQKSKSLSTGWGICHKIIVNRKGNRSEISELYREIGAELIGERQIRTTKKNLAGSCTIL